MFANAPALTAGLLFLSLAAPGEASAQASNVKAEEVRANVGSQWTYETIDEITKAKSIAEQVVTEVKGDQIVLRLSFPPTGNVSTAVADRDWNFNELGLWRYRPNDYSGIRRSGEAPATAPPAGEIEASFRQTTGWSPPFKIKVSTRVLGTENLTTPAGTFETIKVEYVKRMPTPGIPLSETVSTDTKWFAPAVDHFVKMTNETRVDDRLRSRVTSELQKYVLEK
jgi:hypothetical protein